MHLASHNSLRWNGALVNRTNVSVAKARHHTCRPVRTLSVSNGAAPPAILDAEVITETDAPEVVDYILSRIANTDYGSLLTRDDKKEIDVLLNKLEKAGSKQQPRPLKDNDLLWGNYVVAYTSAGRSQDGEPAGGRFRSSLGRALFQTTGLFQSCLLAGPTVVNQVAFRLFGFIKGSVSLRGKVIPLAYAEFGGDDTAKVQFEPPRINLGPFSIKIGPPSSVVLTTTYLDEKIRLGRGSRGSLFIFTRGGQADLAGMESVGTNPDLPLKPLAVAAALAIVYCGFQLVRTQTFGLVGNIAGALLLVVGAAITWALYRGGIEQDRNDDPEKDLKMKRNGTDGLPSTRAANS